MTRFTTDNPSGIVEGYRNTVIIKDKDVYISLAEAEDALPSKEGAGRE